MRPNAILVIDQSFYLLIVMSARIYFVMHIKDKSNMNAKQLNNKINKFTVMDKEKIKRKLNASNAILF